MARKFKVALLLIVLTASNVFALDELQIQKQSEHIYGLIMSPYCPGRTLTNCPSTAAIDLKEKIRAEIAGGKSSQEVIQELLDKFGQDKLAAPRNSGFGRLAWSMPIFFLLIGGIATILWVRKNRSARNQIDLTKHDDLPEKIDPSLEERINSDLSKI